MFSGVSGRAGSQMYKEWTGWILIPGWTTDNNPLSHWILHGGKMEESKREKNLPAIQLPCCPGS